MEKGPFHHRAGPRLPASPSPKPTMEDIGDPVKGAKVPRCLTCGLPHADGNKLMEFGLVYAGKQAGRYRLCERCWLHANPPIPADPLYVDEAA